MTTSVTPDPTRPARAVAAPTADLNGRKTPVTLSNVAEPQWRLLNLIHRFMFLREARTASRLLGRADVAEDVAIGLQTRGWVRATRRRQAGISEPVLLITDGLDWDAVELTLTPAGVGWCDTDPCNQVVRALAGRFGPCRLRRVLAVPGVSLDAVLVCATNGLVDLFDARYRPLSPVADHVTQALRVDPDAVSAQITTAGNRLVYA